MRHTGWAFHVRRGHPSPRTALALNICVANAYYCFSTITRPAAFR